MIEPVPDPDDANWPPPTTTLAPRSGTNPQPAEVPAVNMFKQILINAVGPLLMLAGFVAYLEIRGDRASPASAVDGQKLGRAYAPEVVATLADAWERGADAVEAKAPMDKVQATVQDAWQSARVAAFTQTVQPEFARVLANGAEPTDAQRPIVARLWRDFAAGLRKKGGK